MTFCRNLASVAALAAISSTLAPPAFGQAIDIPQIVTSDRGPSTWINAGYSHQFKTNVRNSPAKFERESVQGTAGHRFKVSDEVFLIANAAYHGTYYNFTKGTGPTNRLTWNDVHQGTLSFGVGWKISEDWTLVGLGLIKSAGESGASFDDTLTAGGAVAVDYKWSDDLSTGVIIGVLSQLEDSAGLLPIPTVDWRFADGWLFHFGLVGMTHPGVGPEISWRSEDVQLAIGGSFQKRRYRLDSRAGPESKGIGEERAFPVFARASWNASENVSLGAHAGVTLGGQLRSGRSGGGKIFKENYSPAPFAGANVSFRF